MNKKIFATAVASALLLSACSGEPTENAGGGNSEAKNITIPSDMSEQSQNIAKNVAELGVRYEKKTDDIAGTHYEFRVDENSKLVTDAVKGIEAKESYVSEGVWGSAPIVAGDQPVRTDKLGNLFSKEAIESGYIQKRLADTLNRIDTGDLFKGMVEDKNTEGAEGEKILTSQANAVATSQIEEAEYSNVYAAADKTLCYSSPVNVLGFGFNPEANLEPVKEAQKAACANMPKMTPYSMGVQNFVERSYPNGFNFGAEFLNMYVSGKDKQKDFELRFAPTNVVFAGATTEDGVRWGGKATITLEFDVHSKFFPTVIPQDGKEPKHVLIDEDGKEVEPDPHKVEERTASVIREYDADMPLRVKVSFVVGKDGILDKGATEANFTTLEIGNALPQGDIHGIHVKGAAPLKSTEGKIAELADEFNPVTTYINAWKAQAGEEYDTPEYLYFSEALKKLSEE